MTNQLTYEGFWDGLASFDESVLQSNGCLLKPENRSSAIFPIFKNSSVNTSIQFLSYWLKKHGNNVVVCFTVRNVDGKQLDKSYEIITECRAYCIQISDLFSKVENGFCGSVEVEVFSKNRPLFTFPAITVCYEGNDSSSVVHSCIRTYNNGEVVGDYAIMYPQTGFDLDFSDHTKNLICFFGGKTAVYNLCLELVEGHFSRKYQLELSNAAYGQMHIIWLEDIIGSTNAGLYKKPKCIIHHDLEDVFPRFYVGILNEACAPSMTHTFYDTSEAEGVVNSNTLNLRANNQDHLNYFDSAVSVPLFSSKSFDTVLRTYGQNLFFSGDAVLSIHTLEGDVIYSRSLSQQEVSSLCGNGKLDLSEILNKANADAEKPYCLKLAFVDKKSPFPRRFKLGLNVKRKTQQFGTNICFSPLVILEDTLRKPFNRSWFPVGGPRNYVATIHNTALERMELSETTQCNFEFFNHRGEAFSRCIYVSKNGSVFLDAEQDKELNDFLGKEQGWCMVTSKSYLTDAYYFSLADKQIGGDHAY